MKTNRNTITRITTAAVALIASAVTAHAANRTLILLQENSSGTSYLEGALSGPAQAAADAIIDGAVENGEAAKFQALAAGRYQRFINLSDTQCTRTNLLNQLIRQSKDGFVTDLAILGHGDTDLLSLNNGSLTGSPSFPATRTDHIRALLSQARVRENNPNFQFKLRLVHMCNCFGGTTNDDWLAIGAKTVVGAPRMDWMPEPMNTFFWEDFLKKDKRVSQAAADSLAATRLIWQFVPGYTIVDPAIGLSKIQETQQSVSGFRDLIFKDEFQLNLNQQRTVTVRANRDHNFPGLYLVSGQRYSYTTTGTWKSTFFAPNVNANGHAPGALDGGRRHPSNMMALVGERFGHNADLFSFVGGSGFRIGATNTLTAGGHGFLNLYANDTLTGYADNSGSVNVTIRRIR
ncbi:MAG: hypothetical protein V4584_06230 [Verrucomicrobiota bacterium]